MTAPHTRERDLVMIALFAALIAVLGLIPKLTLASGIPITAQSMGIMLCGTVLGARRGALAVGLFLLLVALGLPLLAGGRGGLGVFLTPWTGFLVGFPIAAFVTGAIMQRMQNAPVFIAAALSSAIGGMLVLYGVAVSYYMFAKPAGLTEAFLTAALPFLIGDILKTLLSAAITQALARARPGALLTRS